MHSALNSLRDRWLSLWHPLKRFLSVSGFLWTARRDPELRQAFRCYVHWLPFNLFSEPAQWLRQLLGTRQRYRVALQRPYDIYVPHLHASPFPQAPYNCQVLESRWQDIRAEYQAIADREGPPPNQAHVLAGRWGTFDMVALGHSNDARASQCPVTMQVVGQLAVVDMVTFSSLAPGSELRPHYGTTNVKLRHQLCLEWAEGARIRVGGEWRTWQEGKCLVIDDSFEHEVLHRGDRRRVVLLVDCWHPDLTPREREFLRMLFPRLK
jgi:aspartate beta-hydroxylase